MYDDDFDDDEWVDDVDDGESEYLACPSCRAEVHEETQQCPHCGAWITPVYAESRVKNWIWRVAAILAILAMLLIVLR